MDHLALPRSLDGCEYLGVVRVSAPIEPASGQEVAEALLDTLKQKAARKGGNTLAVLPGVRVLQGTLRGSVFRCPATG